MNVSGSMTAKKEWKWIILKVDLKNINVAFNVETMEKNINTSSVLSDYVQIGANQF